MQYTARSAAVFVSVLALATLLAGCGALDKPVRQTQYDFGPGALTVVAPADAAARLAPIAIADIESSSTFDGSAILYRLAYADDRQLRPYALARWSAPPPQLVRQRLREVLGEQRTVLTMDQSAVLERTHGTTVRVLRIELEEFSHLFQSPTQSVGLVRLRATLFDSLDSGEKLLGQRALTVQRPATTGDAPGGVRALGAATDAAVQELALWLQQIR